jgi:hypothetical protein
VHHHLINKTTNVMQLGATVFIIAWKALYMFRVLFTPIIRSVLKLYMQLLVQSRIGILSDPVCYKVIPLIPKGAGTNPGSSSYFRLISKFPSVRPYRAGVRNVGIFPQ